MAKELLIVFVYDCERCQKEEDDPHDAVVYFYPSWVSEQQRLALVGQLMGVNQFLSTVFSSPSILALQTGKFAMKPLGRFILCVGTDRNIPDVVLETRINTLYRLIRFYHLDFETMSNKSGPQFSERLNLIFETYLPILQYAGNIFGSIPTFNLPKSASSVFLEAIQILQCFQDKTGVLGGVVLYQNKVVATQMSANLTKLLVITDPYRIKLPAEAVSTQFRLPVGVQLITVFVEKSEMDRLAKEVRDMRAALQSTKLKQQEIHSKEKTPAVKPSTSKELPPAPSYGMKRDVSRIFTVMEEVEGEGDAEGEKVPDVVRDAVKARKTARFLSVAPAGFVIPDLPVTKRAQTTDDIQSKLSASGGSRLSIGYCSLGTLTSEEGGESEQLRPYYNTICDPNFPLFHRSGLPASQALYDSRVTHHYRELSEETNQGKKQRPRSFAVSLDEDRGKKQQARRALNLPLSNTSTDSKDMVPMTELGSRKPNMTIPLTPLMAKLSLLAMEQHRGESTSPSPGPRPTRPVRRSRAQRERQRKYVEPLQENVLYICGYQDMTLLLVLDPATSQDPDQIHALWQMSVSSLNELETHLHHCLEHCPGATACESYSWLSVDPHWGTVQRGGAWAGARLELLTSLHQQFNTRRNLTETIVRSEDSIIYGYQCGGVQIFYQQVCSEGAGLPAPSDLIGVVSLKAKRRLERDHGIVLL
ncbi:uncharacterized protein LOC124367457 isoform X2 [Homalodisca vitripennis]|uniref:uncharacterized protein LOC124367457 isoform X2 n=1 Tax=Homalodisca vitripennis TaxID=197043 RepID=UPI001EE9DD28|nr:uncharacterized protein LOC124367457 isoform X2 [Homalodisca vitripennis]